MWRLLPGRPRHSSVVRPPRTRPGARWQPHGDLDRAGVEAPPRKLGSRCARCPPSISLVALVSIARVHDLGSTRSCGYVAAWGGRLTRGAAVASISRRTRAGGRAGPEGRRPR